MTGAVVVIGVGGVFGAVTSLVNNVPGMLGEVGRSHSEDSAATWTAIFASQLLDTGWAWAARTVLVAGRLRAGHAVTR